MSTRTHGFTKAGISRATVVNRLVQIYRAADADTRAAGLTWYDDAMQFVADASEATDTRVDTVAAVVAALSPQCTWKANKAAALQVLTEGTRKAGILTASYQRAMACLASEDPCSKLTGPKIAAFAENILGDPERVTVDSWAVRAALGKRCQDPTLLLARVGMYEDVADAYQRAARRVGIAPRDLQATVWVAIRGKAD